ncbi:MAG: extensin family protein [Rhizobiaceae bacterium]|nr:extensin family protein [Rhizobiaceae bacterium]
MKPHTPLALAALVVLTGASASVDLPQSVDPPPERPPEAKPLEPVAPPVESAVPPDETACRTELTALGARFKELPPVQEAEGCAMPHPLAVTQMTAEIAIAPEITVNCATALALAKFARDVMSPAAQKAFGSPIRSIAQASGYVCRPRNGTQKLSEHAFGNAVDIASFTLADKKTVAIEPAPPKEHETFLRDVRTAACGPFKTVLGPGSDADHSLHFHFDLAQRRNGGTFCQ